MKTRESQPFPKRPLKDKAIISIVDRQKDLRIEKRKVRAFVTRVLNHEKIDAENLTIYFVGTQEISQLHARYFSDPSPTDTISFPMDPAGTPKRDLGEVFVCPRVAMLYAKEHDLEPFAECMLYLVHGILHLLGYDDKNPTKRKEMRYAERRCMKLLFKP